MIMNDDWLGIYDTYIVNLMYLHWISSSCFDNGMWRYAFGSDDWVGCRVSQTLECWME